MDRSIFEPCSTVFTDHEILDLTKVESAVNQCIAVYGDVRWVIFPYDVPVSMAFSMRAWVEAKLDVEVALLEPDEWLIDHVVAGI